jgi:hypothetical protein
MLFLDERGLMAHGKIKTEMSGTGGGRYMPRADAKKASKKVRRRNGKKAVKEGLKG